MCREIKLFFAVFFITFFSFFIFLPSAFVYADIPHLINYQGRLTDTSGVPLNGLYNITFRIYDTEAAGNLLWQGTYNSVSINKGIFSILLGDINDSGFNFTALAFDKPYFLEIKVGDDVLSPRQRIASVGYAIRAEKAEKLKDASAIESGVVSTARLGSGSASADTFLRGDQTWSSVPGRQLFTSSGKFTAPAGVTTVFITMVGGGGGGGGCGGQGGGGGGGSGAAIMKFPYTVTPGNTYIVTIGVAGSGGVATSGNGGDGGCTSFDLLTVLGGSGGTGGKFGVGGTGGFGGTGASNVAGCLGKAGFSGSSGGNGGTSNAQGAGGGGSIMGCGGNGGINYNGVDQVIPTSGYGYGSGGGAGGSNAAGLQAGAAGRAGCCLVEW